MSEITEERRPWLQQLHVGERVEIEAEHHGAVVRDGAAVTVETRYSGRLAVVVRGHGRIWDGTTSTEPTAGEVAGMVAQGLEVVRWTPEQGPAPGTCVITHEALERTRARRST
jgi:hypothetical protein